MTHLSELTVFGGKIEATRGTKETLTVTEAAFNVYDLKIEPDVQFNERDAQGGFGNQKAVPGGRKGKATFKVDLAYDGIAIPTWADLLFPGCGLTKTARVFAPKSQSPDAAGATVKTLTIGKWTDRKYSCIYGAMGNVKAMYSNGKIPILEFEFEGIYGGETDSAMVAPTYPTEAKLVMMGAPVTYDAVALCLESLSLDVGNSMYLKECPNSDFAYEYAVIKQRKSKVTANPESKLVASQDRMGLYLAGTEKVLRVVCPAAGYVLATGAKSVEFLASQAQLIKNGPGDRNGVVIDDMEFQLNQAASTLDSEFTITFNA